MKMKLFLEIDGKKYKLKNEDLRISISNEEKETEVCVSEGPHSICFDLENK